MLEKYGGESPAGKKKKAQKQEGEVPGGGKGGHGKGNMQQGTPNRTGLPPPPTANIPGRVSRPETPHGKSAHLQGPGGEEPGAEFAPNAFEAGSAAAAAMAATGSLGPDQRGAVSPPAAAQYAPAGSAGPQWYDRFLDLIVGEDEQAARNRIVLICSSCRLVNGQAPPGTRSLAEIGRWRCMACQAWNGEEKAEEEGQRIVREALGRRRDGSEGLEKELGVARDVDGGEEDGEGGEDGEIEELIRGDREEAEATKEAGSSSKAGPRRRKGKGNP